MQRPHLVRLELHRRITLAHPATHNGIHGLGRRGHGVDSGAVLAARRVDVLGLGHEARSKELGVRAVIHRRARLKLSNLLGLLHLCLQAQRCHVAADAAEVCGARRRRLIHRPADVDQ